MRWGQWGGRGGGWATKATNPRSKLWVTRLCMIDAHNLRLREDAINPLPGVLNLDSTLILSVSFVIQCIYILYAFLKLRRQGISDCSKRSKAQKFLRISKFNLYLRPSFTHLFLSHEGPGTWALVTWHSGKMILQRQGTQINKIYHPSDFIFLILRKKMRDTVYVFITCATGRRGEEKRWLLSF